MVNFLSIGKLKDVSYINRSVEGLISSVRFSGIGYFVLPYLLCTGAFMVHACEWNPDAVMFLRRNLHLNNVHHLCTIHEGDNREVRHINV